MSLGLMTKKAELLEVSFTTDTEGFSARTVAVLANLRVFVEQKHASERWANLAAFSEATDLFRFRKIPGVTVTTKQLIRFEGNEYNILSVENIKGRNMYIEVMAKMVESSQ